MNNRGTRLLFVDPPRVGRPVPWSMVFLALVVAATALGCACLYIGHRVGFARAVAEAGRPVVLTKACPAPPQALTQWNCSPSERRDYQNICLNRIAQTWRGK